jgi:TP901 family phage tail tape measure protein
VSTDGLGAEAVLKLTGVSVGINEQITQITRWRDEGVLTAAQAEKLERALLSVDTTAKKMAGTFEANTVALSQYAAGFDVLDAKLRAFAVSQRLAAQAGVVAGSTDGQNVAGLSKLSTAELERYIAIDDARGQNAVSVARKIVAARQAEAAAIEAAAAKELASWEAESVRLDAVRTGEDRIYNQLLAGQVAATEAAAAKELASWEAEAVRLDVIRTNEDRIYNQLLAGQVAAGEAATATLRSQRVAFNEVAGGLAGFGAGLLAIPVISAIVAADYQRDMATVERATLSPPKALAALKEQLIGLSETIPLTFKQLTNIAGQGAQFGIPEAGLVRFTKIIAELTATTTITATSAELMFSRFAHIDEVKPQDYEKVGAAILNVGIHSGATEAQIASLTTRILGIGQQAGLTIPQVIGLGAALAAVSTNGPARAAGTVVRFVEDIQKAVDTGGPALEAFAKTAGISAETVVATFGTSKFAGVFQQFIDGLHGVQQSGGDAVAVLHSLGISSVYDVPLLLNLASAHETLRISMEDAAYGYAHQEIVALHFSKIQDTLKSQNIELKNTFGALADEIGGGSTPILLDLSKALEVVVKGVDDLIANPTGRMFVEWAGGAAVVIGALALLAAGVSRTIGAFQGFRESVATVSEGLRGLTARNIEVAESSRIVVGAVGSEAIAVDGLSASLNGVSTAAGAAGISSLATLGIFAAAAAVVVGGIVAVNAIYAAKAPDPAVTTTTDFGKELHAGTVTDNQYSKVAGGVSGNKAPIQVSDVANAYGLDKALSKENQQDLILSYYQLTEAGKKVGQSTKDIATNFPLATEAYKKASTATQELAKVSTDLGDGLLTAAKYEIQFLDAVGKPKDLTNAEASYSKSISGLTSMSSAISSVQKTMQEAAQDTADSINKGGKASVAAAKSAAQGSYDGAVASAAQTKAASLSAAANDTNKTSSHAAKSAADAQYTSAIKAAEATKKASDASAGSAKASVSAKDFYDGTSVSLAAYTAQLQTNAATLTTWNQNLTTVTLAYGNQVAAQFQAEGANATSESLLAQLAAATPAQGKAYVDAQQAVFDAAGKAQADTIIASGHLVKANGKTIGTEEAQAIGNAMLAGEPMTEVLKQYGLIFANQAPLYTVTVGADTTLAAQQIADLFKLSGVPAPVGILKLAASQGASNSKHGFADGGYTGDAPASQAVGVVHGGEFVFSAPAVQSIGAGALAFEHQRALRGYDTGGYVGSPGGSSAFGTGSGGSLPIFQLGPYDRALLERVATNTGLGLQVTGNALQKVASASSITSTQRGSA